MRRHGSTVSAAFDRGGDDVPIIQPEWARRIADERYRKRSLDRERRKPVERIAAPASRSATDIAPTSHGIDRDALLGQSRLDPVPAALGSPVVGLSGTPLPASAMSPCVPSPLTPAGTIGALAPELPGSRAIGALATGGGVIATPLPESSIPPWVPSPRAGVCGVGGTVGATAPATGGTAVGATAGGGVVTAPATGGGVVSAAAAVEIAPPVPSSTTGVDSSITVPGCGGWVAAGGVRTAAGPVVGVGSTTTAVCGGIGV